MKKNILQKELDTYYKHKPELLKSAKGKYVLIKNNQIIDTFETDIDAIKQGYKKFGNVPYMVRQVQEIEPVYKLTSSFLKF